METVKKIDRKVTKTAFGISAGLAALLLVILLISMLTKKKEPKENAMVVMQPIELTKAFPNAEDQPLTGALQQRLTRLQRLQQGYSTKLIAGAGKPELDSIKKSILVAEEAFRMSIDSVWIEVIADKNADSSQLKTIAYYRSSLDSVRAINSGNTASAGINSSVADREAFVKLQNELIDKTNKIALLESSIQLMNKRATGMQPDVANNQNNNNQLIQDNAALETKVADLANSNQRLQQEIERLRKQPMEALKNNNTEQVWAGKTAALQQKVNTINAELQLVRVDCNLSRVDATQIISNSKQRKQLLSEASTILTDLSASTDADIRNKVKEKIIRLNQVAANTRD